MEAESERERGTKVLAWTAPAVLLVGFSFFRSYGILTTGIALAAHAAIMHFVVYPGGRLSKILEESGPSKEMADSADTADVRSLNAFFAKWGLLVSVVSYVIGIGLYFKFGTDTWLHTCAMSIPVGLASSILGMSRSNTKVPFTGYLLAATLVVQTLFSLGLAWVMPETINLAQNSFPGNNFRQLRTMISFPVGMTCSGIYDVLMPLVQKWVGVFDYWRLGLTDKKSALRKEISVKVQFWKMLDSTFARLAFAVFLHDLSVNGVPKAYSAIVMFTFGFMINVYRSWMTHRSGGVPAWRGVFMNGLGIVYGCYLLHPTTALVALAILALSYLYFFYGRQGQAVTSQVDAARTRARAA